VSAPAAVVGSAPRTRTAPRSAARAQPARGRHLRLVAPAARTRWLPRPAILAVVGTLVIVFALVVVHVMLAQSQLSLDNLNNKVGAAQRRYDQALLVHAQLAAPSRVITRAAQLGLVPPAQPPVAVPVAAAAVPTAARTATPVPRP
jgi:hypothetical protein